MWIFFETTEEYAERKACEAIEAIREAKDRKHTENEIEEDMIKLLSFDAR